MPKLFAVMLGGRTKGCNIELHDVVFAIGEIHEINFYVASEKKEVIARAKQELCLSLEQQHCDDNLIVDDLMELNELDEYFIELKATTTPSQLKITSRYLRLDVPDILQQAKAIKNSSLDMALA